MKIFVFGSNGMLGRYVSTYFKMKDYNVIDITRLNIDATDIQQQELYRELLCLGLTKGDVVINCVGLIKQRSGVENVEFIQVNSVFPHMLANICFIVGAHMIHPSTDCVYSGLRGSYCEDDIHDVTDIYGKTKSLGEPNDACVIRTSIIGEELKNKASFIEWVKLNKDKTVNGYTNHFWNGITCLEFAEIAWFMVYTGLYWKGARNIFTPTPINKYGLAMLVSEIFDLNVTVLPTQTPIICNRTLTTIHNDVLLDPPMDYRTQLMKLREYHKILTGE